MSITCLVKQMYFFRSAGKRRRRKAVGFSSSDDGRQQSVVITDKTSNYTVAGSCRAIQWEPMM